MIAAHSYCSLEGLGGHSHITPRMPGFDPGPVYILFKVCSSNRKVHSCTSRALLPTPPPPHTHTHTHVCVYNIVYIQEEDSELLSIL